MIDGVALSGGAARGLLHLGVLRALDEAGESPRVVVGCSMGALVGAFYALTGSSWDAEELARDMGRKVNPFKYREIEDYLSELFGDTRIEDLPVKFGAVAVWVPREKTGWLPHRERVVPFTRGSLYTAVRASIGLPGLFPPIGWKGGFLVDGGILDPVPAWLARKLGAKVLLTVDLPPMRRKPAHAWFTLATAPWGYRVHKARRAARGCSDYYLAFRIGVPATAYHLGEHLARIGWRKTRELLNWLRDGR